MLSEGAYSETQLWGMRVSEFASLERDMSLIVRERIANEAKAAALGGAKNPHEAIRDYLDGKFW